MIPIFLAALLFAAPAFAETERGAGASPSAAQAGAAKPDTADRGKTEASGSSTGGDTKALAEPGQQKPAAEKQAPVPGPTPQETSRGATPAETGDAPAKSPARQQ